MRGTLRAATLAALWLCAGCGRLDFVAGPDAFVHDGEIGHDEDGDGVADAIDNCPCVAGPQTDRDGDGVGDICDPEQHELTVMTLQAGQEPFDFTELNELGSGSDEVSVASITEHTTAMGYRSAISTPLVDHIHTGVGELRTNVTGESLSLFGGWADDTYSLNEASANYQADRAS